LIYDGLTRAKHLAIGLAVIIRFGFDEFGGVGDQASQTYSVILAGFGFNMDTIPTRWGSHPFRNTP
jgi:hypothetical protein